MSLLFAMPGNEALAAELAALSGWETGMLEARRFPDGETYVRVETDVTGRDTAIVCTLAWPDERFLGLVYASRLLRDLGAKRVALIAPYLPYLRQDRKFQAGEAESSLYFADLLGREFDSLITVTPHLHRHKALGEIYAIPAEEVSAAPLLAAWVKANVPDPLIVGPDRESEPWVAEIGEAVGAPYVVFDKQRSGDREVAIVAPDLTEYRGRRPVLVDDIVSSGATLAKAIECLVGRGFQSPHCLIVHALLDETTYAQLSTARTLLVSTDSVPHATSAISVAPLLAARLRGGK